MTISKETRDLVLSTKFDDLLRMLRSRIQGLANGSFILDDLILEVLEYHPRYTEKMCYNGVRRLVRKDYHVGSPGWKLVCLNSDGSIYDDISLKKAVMASRGIFIRQTARDCRFSDTYCKR